MSHCERALQGPPYKFALRVLTEKYLKRRIQMGEHDSVQVSWQHCPHDHPWPVDSTMDVRRCFTMLPEERSIRGCVSSTVVSC